MEIARKFYIMTASIGTGHSQAARAIAEAIQRTHPADSVQVLDFVSSNLFSIDHIIKDGYHEDVDRYRKAKTEGKSWLAKLEAEERDKTGIKNLKI